MQAVARVVARLVDFNLPDLEHVDLYWAKGRSVALGGRNPYLVPGDVIDLEADGLGHQRQHVRQAWPVRPGINSAPLKVHTRREAW